MTTADRRGHRAGVERRDLDGQIVQISPAEYERYQGLVARERRRTRRRATRRPGDDYRRRLMSMAVYAPGYLADPFVDFDYADLREVIDAFNKVLDLAVGDMLDAGASWTEVAKALGMLRSTAKSRFRHVGKSHRPPGGQPSELR